MKDIETEIREWTDRLAMLEVRSEELRKANAELEGKRKALALPAMGMNDEKSRKDYQAVSKQISEGELEARGVTEAISEIKMKIRDLERKLADAEREAIKRRLAEKAKTVRTLAGKLDKQLDTVARSLDEIRATTYAMQEDHDLVGLAGKSPAAAFPQSVRQRLLDLLNPYMPNELPRAHPAFRDQTFAQNIAPALERCEEAK